MKPFSRISLFSSLGKTTSPSSYVHWLKLENTIPFLIKDGPIIDFGPFGPFQYRGQQKGVKSIQKRTVCENWWLTPVWSTWYHSLHYIKLTGIMLFTSSTNLFSIILYLHHIKHLFKKNHRKHIFIHYFLFPLLLRLWMHLLVIIGKKHCFLKGKQLKIKWPRI